MKHMKFTPENIAIVDGDMLLCKEVEELGRLDVAHQTVDLMKPYIPVGGVVLDVGACIGDHTITYSEFVGHDGLVIAFEPNPVAFQCLKHNVMECFKFKNVNLHHVALGAAHGWATPTTVGENLGATRLSNDGEGTIPVAPLDLFSESWTRLDFMKIDAEGYEPLILDGARETLMRLRPVMLIEVNDEMLGHLGFKPDDIYSRLIELQYSFEVSPRNSYDLLCKP